MSTISNYLYYGAQLRKRTEKSMMLTMPSWFRSDGPPRVFQLRSKIEMSRMLTLLSPLRSPVIGAGGGGVGLGGGGGDG